MEMRKWIYLAPFLSAPSRSTLHYYSRNLTKRNSPQQTQTYEISACAKIEIVNNFMREKLPLHIKGIQ